MLPEIYWHSHNWSTITMRLGDSYLGYLVEESDGRNAELLAHLREPGPHLAGCWLVEAVLVRAAAIYSTLSSILKTS